jgi:hypothetical protein
MEELGQHDETADREENKDLEYFENHGPSAMLSTWLLKTELTNHDLNHTMRKRRKRVTEKIN